MVERGMYSFQNLMLLFILVILMVQLWRNIVVVVFYLNLSSTHFFRCWFGGGNGKNIRIWDDPILGDLPLGHREDLANIKIWIQNRNLKTLWDISSWTEDEEESWES